MNGHPLGNVRDEGYEPGEFGEILGPCLLRMEGKEDRPHTLWDYVRVFLLASQEKIGAQFTPGMIFSRRMVRSFAFRLYRLHDAGAHDDAWSLAVIMAIIEGNGKATEEIVAELHRRARKGDSQSGQLIYYASMTETSPLWWTRNVESDGIRLETYEEAALRHLWLMVVNTNSEEGVNYHTYLHSMVMHGFFLRDVGQEVFDEALKERARRM